MAIREVERVFHKSPQTRAANPASALSVAGKELLVAFENERDDARALGNTADWWSGGSNRKGVSTTERQAYAVSNSHRLPMTFHSEIPIFHGLLWL